MTKLMILGGVAAFVLLAVGILTSLPARADNNANSQLYPNGRYALVIRVDSHEGEQMLGLALSDDGIHFTVEPEPILRPDASECGHLNDPRITMIDGEYILSSCGSEQ